VTPPQQPELSPLAEALGTYLDRNPHAATETPSWLSLTLWAYDLVEGKPTPPEISAAIEELSEGRPTEVRSPGGLGGRLRKSRAKRERA
jgi:hypothetical protein